MKIDELITELNLVQDQNKQVVILIGDDNYDIAASNKFTIKSRNGKLCLYVHESDIIHKT